MRDAASILGISKDAVRKRISRGTLPSDVGEDGRRYVYLDAAETLQGERPDTTGPTPAELKLVEALRDQVSYLREQLDAERQARTEERRRQDTIIAQLTARIPELEAPRDERESPTPPSEAQEASEGAEPRSGTEGQQQATERVSWWRRFFGFD